MILIYNIYICKCAISKIEIKHDDLHLKKKEEIIFIN